MLVAALQHAGIEADVFGRVAEAWQAMDLASYAAMVLDRGLPDGDGLAFLQRLREAGDSVPCLILTARDAVNDRIEGLNRGADDYLTKPFSIEELVARVQALLRRPPMVRAVDPVHGDLRLSAANATLRCGGNSVVLPASELQIMAALMQAAGDTVRRQSLEHAAWGLGEAVTPNALDVALHRLRRKLETIGSTYGICNVRGAGYAVRKNG